MSYIIIVVIKYPTAGEKDFSEIWSVSVILYGLNRQDKPPTSCIFYLCDCDLCVLLVCYYVNLNTVKNIYNIHLPSEIIVRYS